MCDGCDALSPIHVTVCERCGAALSLLPPTPTASSDEGADEALGEATAGALPAGASPLIDSAAPSPRTCVTCGEALTPAHRFCGGCGTPVGGVPLSDGAPATRARLVIIKSDGFDGMSYRLGSDEQVVGRTEGDIRFPHDALLSPRHARFYYRDGVLHVRDEHPDPHRTNGVFRRLRGPTVIDAGQPILIGEQILVLRPPPPLRADGGADGTAWFGSPPRPAQLRVVQLLAGGGTGMVACIAGSKVSIGREGNQVNFPDDPYISGRHLEVEPLDDGRYRITDRGSKNGTFVRVRGELRLEHGDFLFLGQQLLRIEME